MAADNYTVKSEEQECEKKRKTALNYFIKTECDRCNQWWF